MLMADCRADCRALSLRRWSWKGAKNTVQGFELPSIAHVSVSVGAVTMELQGFRYVSMILPVSKSLWVVMYILAYVQVRKGF